MNKQEQKKRKKRTYRRQDKRGPSIILAPDNSIMQRCSKANLRTVGFRFDYDRKLNKVSQPMWMAGGFFKLRTKK